MCLRSDDHDDDGRPCCHPSVARCLPYLCLPHTPNIAVTIIVHHAASDNVARIARLGTTFLDTWACSLEFFANRTDNAPVTPYGIVSAPVMWEWTYNLTSTTSQDYDRLVIASADGSVYALNWEVCALGDGGKQAVCNHTKDSVPIIEGGQREEAAALRGATAAADEAFEARKRLLASLGGGPSCKQFVTVLPSRQPSFSPPRHVPATNPPPGVTLPSGGILLVSTTDPNLDSNGNLYALNADTGAVLWSHSATVNGTSYGLRGVVPAIDISRGSMVYLAYGPSIVALFINNGSVATSYTVPGGIDGFVSSPVLTADYADLLLHSATGTVWRFTVTNDPVSAIKPVFTRQWACDYTLAAYYAGNSTCTVGHDAPVHDAEVPVYRFDAATGARSWVAGDVRTIPRSHFSSGGWNQLMTSEEVAALHTDLQAMAAAQPGYTASSIEGLTSHEAASLHASLLTPEQLDAIGAGGASHARLDGVGRPRWLQRSMAKGNAIKAGPGFETTFPYATPGLVPDENYFILPQYLAYGTGDTGLFAAQLSDGRPVWAYAGFFGVPFGRSRSSPALDVDGGLYCGADIDYAANNDSLPVLFAWQLASTEAGPAGGYNLRWATSMDEDDNFFVGSASPVVKYANASGGQNELVMASGNGAEGFREGYACPTQPNELELDCSGHGDCDCYIGVCTCHKGWLGLDCAKPEPGPDDGFAPGAQVMAYVTVGSLGAIVVVAAAAFVGKKYGINAALTNLWRGVSAKAGSSSSGSSYGSNSAEAASTSYDTRPFISKADTYGFPTADAGIGEGSSLLKK